MPLDPDIDTLIRAVLHAETGIEATALAEDEDLYQAGMSSFTSVNVMLALEERLDVEFADHMLNRTTFSTIGHLTDALTTLLEEATRA